MQTPDQLADTAAFLFGVDKRAIFGDSRTARAVQARQALAWALRQHHWSLQSIGAFLRRDHSTIIYALEMVEKLRARSAEYCARLTVLVGDTAPPPIDWEARITAMEKRIAQLEQKVQ